MYDSSVSSFSGDHVAGANQTGIPPTLSAMPFSSVGPRRRGPSSAPTPSVTAASRRGRVTRVGSAAYSDFNGAQNRGSVVSTLQPRSVQSSQHANHNSNDLDERTKIAHFQDKLPIWGNVLGLQAHIVNFFTWKDPFLVVIYDQSRRWLQDALEWHYEDSADMVEGLSKSFMPNTIRSSC
jgi:hypothetical protein